MTEPICLMCKRPLPSKRLLCANCRSPIERFDRWHHDEGSRAVHDDCDQPKGAPKLKKAGQ